jgi:pyrroloquinoline quinone biosynthesis protein B
MRAIVLGAAAGGGFPQWNSNAPGCRRARSGDPAARPRTQASLAVSGDDRHWFLLNASPDLREQLFRTPELHPSDGLRSTPISGVILTSGEVDAVAGLLNLREREPFTLYATPQTLAVLAANPIFDVLASGVVARRAIELDETIALEGGLTAEMFAVPGKVPLYLEETAAEAEGDVVGVTVRQNGSTLCYVPGCAAMNERLAARLRGADVVLFDGTLWTDDEMIRAGLGAKTGQRMGHMSVAGPDGVMAQLANLPIGRKILVHINNSNPILLDDSPERAQAAAAGWEVGFDGMEMRL